MTSTMRLRRMVPLLVVVLALASGCDSDPEPEDGNSGIANPASVYCEEQGGTLEFRTGDDGGQVGYCMFADGSECEEWAYYRSECEPGS